MSKISYPQLVKNLADAYRTAIGSTEPIVVGELANKVTEAIGSGGGGDCVQYKSITYNADNTIILIDSDDVEHIMSCVYEDGKITSITLDDEEIKLSYDGDDLIAVENTAIDLSNAPIPKVDGVSIYGGLLKPTATLTLDINTITEVIESEE